MPRHTVDTTRDARLVTGFDDFLTTDTGRYLVTRFRDEYPDANVTEVKMLDLVLWQTRTK